MFPTRVRAWKLNKDKLLQVFLSVENENSSGAHHRHRRRQHERQGSTAGAGGHGTVLKTAGMNGESAEVLMAWIYQSATNGGKQLLTYSDFAKWWGANTARHPSPTSTLHAKQ